ncbi:hypothetical protein [Kluyvera genomosp. 3]|uniref:Uncharacterized protein n=1 Tax=Kluyvera genomosp. 3 TaxID=2774055 RepID=A0A6G9RKV2_9ENTR|nr:hypothetical protein [Kluyvera genomosp. 3]QIR27540.1 hypothetical protein GY169_12330 [Kluyvera genomosp. 3]
MFSNKTNEELIALATKMAGYSDAGAVLKEMVKRCQAQHELSEQQHEQSLTLAAESELIRQYAHKQAEAVEEVLKLLSDSTEPVSPVVLAASAEKLVPTLTLDNVVNQISAVTLVDLRSAIDEMLAATPRISTISEMDKMAFTHCVNSVIARSIAELLYLPIGPVEVERGDDGYWTHPAAALQPDWDEGTSSAEMQDWYLAQGLEVKTVNLEDQDYDLQERILEEAGELREWDPLPPDGDGWFLFCIFDTESGAHAEFARRLPV